MPDVTLPSGLVQPAISSIAWGPKQHGNLALIDPLFARVATLEAALPTEYLSLGTTFPQIQEAVLDSSPGTRIILPNETVEQSVTGTSVLWLDRWLELLGHPGGESELLLNGNVGDGGTAHQIAIGGGSGVVIPRMRLSGFKLRHNRVASPDMRCCAIDLAYRCNNLEIDNMTFEGITSDFFIGRPWPWNVKWGCNGLSIHHNIGTGCWEGFFNWHSGWLYDGRVYNNEMYESTMHATYQGPMMIELNIEQTVGGIEKFYAMRNKSILTGTASGLGGNSLAIGYTHSANYGRGHIYYHDVHVSDNEFNGYYYGAYFPALNETRGKLPAQKTLTVVTKNKFLNCAMPLFIWPDSNEYESARIVSNRCVAGATAAAAGWNELFSGDQEAYCKITNIAQFSLLLGLEDVNVASGPCYQLYFPDATTAQLYKNFDPGYGLEYTQLGANISITHSADDQWKLRRQQDTPSPGITRLSIYKNGGLVATRDDNSAGDVPPLTGDGYLSFIMGQTASIKDFGGGELATTALLDSFTRANENPLNPANWVQNGGWRTASASDKLLFIDNEGNTNVPTIDQTRLGVNGEIEIIQSPDPNAWT